MTGGVASELIALVDRIDAGPGLPPVERLLLPPRVEDPSMQSEFGAVVLADGSAGLFFALLGDTLRELHARLARGAASGPSAASLAAGLDGDDPVERALALGAVCAATQHLFARAGYRPPVAANSLGGDAFTAGDHVGMVGLFPSLSRRLRAAGVTLTVLELRPDRVVSEPRFEVTLDPGRLAACSKVLCTASTLINGTLDEVLAACTGARSVSLIGPSASCLPDPLFARGIDVVAGARVRDADALAASVAAGTPWGASVERYAIEPRAYPGFEALLAATGD